MPILVVATLLLGGGLLGLAVGGGPLAIDLALADAIIPIWPRFATDLFDSLASLPVVLAVGLVAAGASWVAGRRGAAVAFLVGLAAEIPVAIVKAVVDRPRPPGGLEIEAIGSVASYPSGHTVRAVVIGGLLAATLIWSSRDRLRMVLSIVLACALIGLVGMARIASGQHWPTDVLGGILFGGAWLTLCLAVARTIERLRIRPREPPATGPRR